VPAQIITELRNQHPLIRYQDYKITEISDGFQIQYAFFLAPSITFRPTLTIPSKNKKYDGHFERLAFLIGMAELISYWKTSCPKTIEVTCGHLNKSEIKFWTNLIRNGLGEFFYLNKISPKIDFEIISNSSIDQELPRSIIKPVTDSSLILVGGGKDSIVTLELLKQSKSALAGFCLNPIPASLDALKVAGFKEILVSKRKIDPQLLELNSRGYLNGHTPFSALLAFISTLVAYQNGFGRVLSSNESSASEENVIFEGFKINHQYSKSYDFEMSFRDYLKSSNIPVCYLSFLRPLNELQICALFSTFKEQHAIFRSCNREQTMAKKEGAETTDVKRKGWCGRCPKCIFTFITLSCFLTLDELEKIFGMNVLDKDVFLKVARELAGLTTHKPFECVGTYEEVRTALIELEAKLPASELQNTPLQSLISEFSSTKRLGELLESWNDQNFLDSDLTNIIKRNLSSAKGEQIT
jgi:UDP-N-acetyl-alpha-D-muramoyl-L-alanyl-L-glutamate epimerase